MKSAEICRRKKGRFMNPFLESEDQLEYNTNSCGVLSSNPMKSASAKICRRKKGWFMSLFEPEDQFE